MKKAFIFRIVFVAILLLCLSCRIHPVISHAADDSDKPVSDWYADQEDEKGKKTDTENDTSAAEPKGGAAVGLSMGDYFKTIIAFMFVVALLYALLKFINRRNRKYDSHRLMKNMGGLSLGQQKSIQLVLIGERYYIVGVGDNVELLKEITDHDEIDKLKSYLEETDESVASGTLDRLLARFMSKGDSPKQQSEGEADFGRMFKSKIEEMKDERRRHIRRLEEKERKDDE